MGGARRIVWGLGGFLCLTFLAFASAANPAPALNLASNEGTPEAVGAPDDARVATGATSPAEAEVAIPEIPVAEPVFTDDDRLRSAVYARLAAIDRILPTTARKERDALAAFYAERAGETLWTTPRGWAASASGLIARLKAADEDGLDPSDYPVPDMAATGEPTLEDWAEAELKLSGVAVAYARDARGARLEPVRLSIHITPTLDIPKADDVLAALAAADDVGAALADYNPPHAGYRALRLRLEDLRSTRPGPPMVRVPPGPALKVGMRDPRVPLIRSRFGIGPEGDDQTAYDERVASAVAAFQKEKGLPASGVLNAATVAALSGPSAARLESDLIANMERWRWLPRDLGARHVLVNVPEYLVRVVEDGRVVHSTRAIVGKSESPTPIFSDEMEHVIVNPSWTVPPSILKKEFLPALAKDPLYAERKGFKVIRRGDSISIQQPPGDANALGYVKFIFPNEHAVYLHDTPNRRLFGAAQRAFSHGCVRVDQPFRLAEILLKGTGSWTEAKLRGLIGGNERYIRLSQPLPVHLTYFTAAVDERGELKTFNDLYGFHAKVRTALGFKG